LVGAAEGLADGGAGGLGGAERRVPVEGVVAVQGEAARRELAVGGAGVGDVLPDLDAAAKDELQGDSALDKGAPGTSSVRLARPGSETEESEDLVVVVTELDHRGREAALEDVDCHGVEVSLGGPVVDLAKPGHDDLAPSGGGLVFVGEPAKNVLVIDDVIDHRPGHTVGSEPVGDEASEGSLGDDDLGGGAGLADAGVAASVRVAAGRDGVASFETRSVGVGDVV